ncbi:MAG: hypothetical protein PT977_07230 [Acidobacteriota bacterium]|nr:hypothetical protein [Acidobacteriota bacterium]
MRRFSTVFVLLTLFSPVFVLRGEAGAPSVTGAACADPVVVDSAALPWSSAGVDTRSLVDDGAPPVFPCYLKGQLATGGQAPPSRLVWFSFTPVVSAPYRVDTIGTTPVSDYDTILGLYTGSCRSLSAVSGVCRQNGFTPDDVPGSLQSSITVNLSAGTTYMIAIGGVGRPNSFTGAFEPSTGGTLRLNVARVAVSYPYAYVVPSVARAGGFLSDLTITNVEESDGQFVVQFLGHGSDGDQNLPAVQPASSPQRIGPSGSREIPDVLATLFSVSSDYGAILVQSTGRLLVGARTATTAPGGGGTFGQFTEAVDVSAGATPGFALAAGETGYFAAVREDASARTNLVLVNPSLTPCVLQSELRDAGGHVLGGTKTFTVPPRTMIQKNRLKDTYGVTGDVRAASVLVRNVTPGCAVAGTAYVVDGNTTAGTNDPFAVPLRK